MTGWRVVRKGVWLYDQTVPSGVWIIEADYDFWYELDKADGQLEPSEGPELNAAGHRYYAVFLSPPLAGPFWAETGGADTVEEACRQAQLKVPNTIRWEA